MSIQQYIGNLSRRRFFKAAAGATAAAVTIPAVAHITHGGHQLTLEKRIQEFLKEQLTTSSVFAWRDDGQGRSPEKRINNTVRYSPINDRKEFDSVPLCEPPEVAFASATDPKFEELKRPEVVGANHMSPRAWLPSAQSVITVFYPFSEEVRASNRPPGPPSKLWIAAKASSEIFLLSVTQSLISFLAGFDAESVSPAIDPRMRITRFGSTMSPNWSERHVGYVAGLGTFGLHGLLITRKGAAGRLTSVITSLKLTASHRPYKDKNGYCLHYMQNSCALCAQRCPPNAINAGLGRANLCAKYAQQVVGPSVAPLPYKGGCGKCLVGLPCESTIPQGIVSLV